ncbi:MAG: hypothetical protein QOJ86_2383 [Bradyrhizobium sp.]|nr:hypothetical protein [Bradyrhizobium sp.]
MTASKRRKLVVHGYPDAEIGSVIPSIAHALTRLCSMADWPS